MTYDHELDGGLEVELTKGLRNEHEKNRPGEINRQTSIFSDKQEEDKEEGRFQQLTDGLTLKKYCELQNMKMPNKKDPNEKKKFGQQLTLHVKNYEGDTNYHYIKIGEAMAEKVKLSRFNKISQKIAEKLKNENCVGSLNFQNG